MSSEYVTVGTWYTYGSGWECSYNAHCRVTVTRNYGSSVATVYVSEGQMQSPGGDTAAWYMTVSAGGVSRSSSIGGGIHRVGTWYDFSDLSFDVSVGDVSGTLGVNVTFSESDMGYSVSGAHDKTVYLAYNSKGASTISSAANTTLGNAVNIKWTPYSSDFYFKLKLDVGTWSYTTGSIHPNTTSSYTYNSYTMPLNDIATLITNSTTATCTATLYTYTNSSCSSLVATETTKTFTVTVPANSSTKPVITSGSYYITAVNDNSVVNGWGVAVVGYTRINIRAGATAKLGATISTFKITGSASANVSGTSLNTNVAASSITSSGNKSFTIVAVDSRGISSDSVTTNSIYFNPYSTPAISSASFHRSDDNKSNLDLTLSRSYSGVNRDYSGNTITNKNSITCTLKYKIYTNSGWTVYKENNTTYNMTGTSHTTIGELFDQTKTYDLLFTVTDSLGKSATYKGVVSTIFVFMDWKSGGKGVGFGKIAEQDSMEIAYDVKLFNDEYIKYNDEGSTSPYITLTDFVKKIVSEITTSAISEAVPNTLLKAYPKGSIYISVYSDNPSTLFGGTWELFGKGRALVGVDNESSNSKMKSSGYEFGEAEHTLTIDEMPSHSHSIGIQNSGSEASGYGLTGSGGFGDRVMVTQGSTSTNSVGGGNSFSNIPPSITVFIWKRTA